MKIVRALTVSLLSLASVGFAGAASAEDLTRAEVRQQLIQAENDGSRFVTDASYPDVSPVYTQQVARQKQSEENVGGVAGTHSAAASVRQETPSSCVGPVSFCTLYFGS
ncbi:DUF4148 domain-containing protein [Paraburkholderia nodosa]|uniref:DUF4148 domain-containing protein n=1 Tax=Paraburkholderia nodosa TaxID=392320 RepID=UPI000483777F|nr:DUF4148 domain-containing protein [Paraburkholderia nodosa]